MHFHFHGLIFADWSAGASLQFSGPGVNYGFGDGFDRQLWPPRMDVPFDLSGILEPGMYDLNAFASVWVDAGRAEVTVGGAGFDVDLDLWPTVPDGGSTLVLLLFGLAMLAVINSQRRRASNVSDPT
jgi:VPDSG-CTERM motif